MLRQKVSTCCSEEILANDEACFLATSVSAERDFDRKKQYTDLGKWKKQLKHRSRLRESPIKKAESDRDRDGDNRLEEEEKIKRERERDWEKEWFHRKERTDRWVRESIFSNVKPYRQLLKGFKIRFYVITRKVVNTSIYATHGQRYTYLIK